MLCDRSLRSSAGEDVDGVLVTRSTTVELDEIKAGRSVPAATCRALAEQLP